VTIAALTLAMAILVSPTPAAHRLGLNPIRVPHRMVAPIGAFATVVVVAIIASLGAAVAVTVVAGTWESRRRRAARQRRRGHEASALQSALNVLDGELRIGAHPVAALDVAAREVDGVVGASLRKVAARARISADVAAGMRDAAAQSALPEHWYGLATCWELAQAHGLAIGTLMKTAHEDIVERERFIARVYAGMAGARATAAVLAALPVVGIGLGQLIGADPLRFLLGTPSGGWLLGVGVVFACAGLLWADRITEGVAK
jgi:tight adherence protein B